MRILPRIPNQHRDRDEEDDVCHGRTGPVYPREEEKRERDAADGCEAERAAGTRPRGDVPGQSSDEVRV